MLTSSEIVELEQYLNQLDPKLCGDPAMLTAMALKLDETDEQQGMVRTWIAHYVAFRWPNLQRSLRKSLQKGELQGLLLKDVQKRRAVLN